jgi:TonB family protein
MIALLIEAALRSLALGVVVWVGLVALRPRNPHLQKTVWLTVLLASIAMPFVLQWRMAPSFAAPEFLVTLTPDATSATGDASAWLLPVLFTQVLSVVYAAVALGLLARFAFGLVSVWRLQRATVPLARTLRDGMNIRVSPKVQSPATFGSTILLPENAVEWTDAKLDAVLAHERSHVRHKDCYVQWLASLHTCVFWFNPLAWWLQGRLADLAETTSDDAAIEAAADRTAYADLLLEIAQSPPPPKVAMSAARSNIAARIDRIISNIPPAAPPRRWVRWVAAALLIPVFTVAAANLQAPDRATPTAQADDNDPLAPKPIDTGATKDIERYYPPEAARVGKETLVTVSVTLDVEGNVVDAVAVDPTLGDKSWGFDEAAERVARTLRFSNPRHAVTQSRVRVKFELHKNYTGNITSPVPDESWTTTFPDQ